MLCPVCTLCIAKLYACPKLLCPSPHRPYILCVVVSEPTTLHCGWEALCLLQAFLPCPRAC